MEKGDKIAHEEYGRFIAFNQIGESIDALFSGHRSRGSSIWC